MSQSAENDAPDRCHVCAFGPKAHEVVVRRGIFPAHDYDTPIPPAEGGVA